MYFDTVVLLKNIHSLKQFLNATDIRSGIAKLASESLYKKYWSNEVLGLAYHFLQSCKLESHRAFAGRVIYSVT